MADAAGRRLRRKATALVLALVAGSSVAGALLTRRLLRDLAVAGAGDGAWLSWPPLAAAEQLLVLGALALGLVAAALAIVAVRLALLDPFERLTAQAREAARALGDKPRPDDDAFEQVAAVLRAQQALIDDDTHALRSERAGLLRYREAARAATDQLISADRRALVGQLALGMAHELGGPLGVAMGSLDLLESMPEDQPDAAEATQRYIDDTRDAIERVDRLVRTLLAFGRGAPDHTPDIRGLERGGHGDSGGAESEPGPLLEALATLVPRHPRCRYVQVDVDTSRAPAHLPISGPHLEQVVLNLLLNAADAMGGRGRATVQAYTDNASGERVVEVDDEGPGVPEAERGAIFEPFVSAKAPGEGTGLGLPVCKLLVERSGGSIRAVSAPGGGARMQLRWPAAGEQTSRGPSPF